ncbi:MAG: hypothetical protein KBD29_03640 [Candidatus Magasanikbacteria bacterium]|nr:hypothetical protein [Candidatus Magasanikbacteria bacterium]
MKFFLYPVPVLDSTFKEFKNVSNPAVTGGMMLSLWNSDEALPVRTPSSKSFEERSKELYPDEESKAAQANYRPDSPDSSPPVNSRSDRNP